MAFDLFKRLFGASDESDRRRDPRTNARAGTRVLVIDDSATIVAVLGKMLRQNGYEVLKAGDAESGLEIARAEHPDLIFLDIVLPGMNGFAALRQLRREPGTMRTPVIMISGNMQATEQYYAQRIGADDFMKKPFGRGEVFTRLQKLIEAGRLPPHDGAVAVQAPSADETSVPDIAMPDARDLPPPGGPATAPPTSPTPGRATDPALINRAHDMPAPPPVTERPDV